MGRALCYPAQFQAVFWQDEAQSSKTYRGHRMGPAYSNVEPRDSFLEVTAKQGVW